jgi:hypothetical protein
MGIRHVKEISRLFQGAGAGDFDIWTPAHKSQLHESTKANVIIDNQGF